MSSQKEDVSATGIVSIFNRLGQQINAITAFVKNLRQEEEQFESELNDVFAEGIETFLEDPQAITRLVNYSTVMELAMIGDFDKLQKLMKTRRAYLSKFLRVVSESYANLREENTSLKLEVLSAEQLLDEVDAVPTGVVNAELEAQIEEYLEMISTIVEIYERKKTMKVRLEQEKDRVVSEISQLDLSKNVELDQICSWLDERNSECFLNEIINFFDSPEQVPNHVEITDRARIALERAEQIRKEVIKKQNEIKQESDVVIADFRLTEFERVRLNNCWNWIYHGCKAISLVEDAVAKSTNAEARELYDVFKNEIAGDLSVNNMENMVDWIDYEIKLVKAYMPSTANFNDEQTTVFENVAEVLSSYDERVAELRASSSKDKLTTVKAKGSNKAMQSREDPLKNLNDEQRKRFQVIYGRCMQIAVCLYYDDNLSNAATAQTLLWVLHGLGLVTNAEIDKYSEVLRLYIVSISVDAQLSEETIEMIRKKRVATTAKKRPPFHSVAEKRRIFGDGDIEGISTTTDLRWMRITSPSKNRPAYRDRFFKPTAASRDRILNMYGVDTIEEVKERIGLTEEVLGKARQVRDKLREEDKVKRKARDRERAKMIKNIP